MSYSPEVQARIDAKAAATRTRGPSFPMPRLRHNGETGEWLVREVDGDKNAEEVSVFEREGMVEKDLPGEKGATRKGMVGGVWSGVILRVAWMSQSKYKEGSSFQKMTREFTDFKNEPIELMKRVFGPAGKTESLRIYPNYQAFKTASMVKDEEGNELGSAYDLKAVLYVYHFTRKQVIKLVVGGSARSEWFEYARNKPSGDDGITSLPWQVTLPEAKLLEQVKTEFLTTPAKTDKGMEYYRLSFRTAGLCSEAEIAEAWEVQDKINDWVRGWEEVNKRMHADKAVAPASPVAPAAIPGIPGTAAHAIATAAAREPEAEINLDDIPF